MRIGYLVISFLLLVAGCESEKNSTSLSCELGDVLSVFELKYGDSKEFDYKGEKIVLTIDDVQDSVTLNCSLTDFANNSLDPSQIKVC